jgi:hypothetical protein
MESELLFGPEDMEAEFGHSTKHCRYYCINCYDGIGTQPLTGCHHMICEACAKHTSLCPHAVCSKRAVCVIGQAQASAQTNVPVTAHIEEEDTDTDTLDMTPVPLPIAQSKTSVHYSVMSWAVLATRVPSRAMLHDVFISTNSRRRFTLFTARAKHCFVHLQSDEEGADEHIFEHVTGVFTTEQVREFEQLVHAKMHSARTIAYADGSVGFEVCKRNCNKCKQSDVFIKKCMIQSVQ